MEKITIAPKEVNAQGDGILRVKGEVYEALFRLSKETGQSVRAIATILLAEALKSVEVKTIKIVTRKGKNENGI